MKGGKTVSIPLASDLKLCLSDCPKSDADKAEMTKVPYLSAVGSLMYAMICTRLDIAYAMGESMGTWQILARSIGKNSKESCVTSRVQGECVFALEAKRHV